MKKVLVPTAYLLAALGLAGCELPFDLAPGGSCEVETDAVSGWIAPYDHAPLEPLEDAATAPRRWVVQFEERAGFGELASGARALRGDERAALVERAGGRVVRRFERTGMLAAVMEEEEARALSRAPGVRSVEEDPPRHLLSQQLPAGVAQIGAPAAWQQAGGAVARGVKTCIVDSGLYAPHEDLPAAGVSGHPAGWNEDACSHGTHVAGTVAALDNGVGVVGVSPRGADLFVVKVFGDDCGWSYASELADAVGRCADAGAQVVNMSLGGRIPSELERDAFEAAWARGLLLVAAAGNSGTTELQYPASYPAVLSVGAVDGKGVAASFSQRNGQVDLVAPGVRVQSTVGFASRHEVVLGATTLQGAPIEHAAATAGVTGALIDGGRCEQAGSWKGRVVACARGGNTFAQKVDSVRRGGGVAAVIVNSEAGPFQGTLGDSRVALPALALPGDDRGALLEAVGQPVTVVNELPRPGSGYAAYSGTSMAAPHVAGVASLVWGQVPARRNAEVRRALVATASDLGPAGRDDVHGHGLVRADGAMAHLREAPAERAAPESGFFVRCRGAACTFVDTSFHPDGATLARALLVEGGRVELAGRRVVHSFARPGPHRVTLEAKDERGAVARWTREVDVLALSAQGSGRTLTGGRDVALRWTGAGGDRVTVVRDGKAIATAKNTGEAVDSFTRAPTGTTRYRVCDEALASCSNEVAVAPLCAR